MGLRGQPCAEGSAALLRDGTRRALLSLRALPEGRPWVLGRGISGEGAGQAVCVESDEEKRVWRALSAAEFSAVFSVSAKLLPPQNPEFVSVKTMRAQLQQLYFILE